MSTGSPGATLRGLVRVQRFGGAKDMTRGAVWCFGGLVVVASLLRLLAEPLGIATLVVGVPLGILAVGLLLIGGLCGVCAPILWAAALLSRRRPGSIRVADGLVVEERSLTSVFPLVSVAGARISPFEDELLLEMRDGDVVRAQIRSLDEGEALLDSIAAGTVRGTWLGSLHPRKHTPPWAQWPWLSAAGAALLATAIGTALLDGTGAAALGVLAFAAVRLVAGWLRTPPTAGCVVVGHDGIALKESGKERFIGFRSIHRVNERETGLSLELTGGESIRLDLIPAVASLEASLERGLYNKRRAHVLALLRERIGACKPASSGAGSLLERKGRSVARWRADLADLVRESGGGYRRAMLPREQAIQVLEDGDAPGELRIGAALALTSGPTGARSGVVDAETLGRLRIAVETCVHQEVRTALREAVYGELDDETLDRATLAASAR